MKKTVEIKNGKAWVVEFVDTDELLVYKSLTDDLIAKKINQCSYIKSIKRTQLYNGTQKITVVYNNDCRAIYEITDY